MAQKNRPTLIQQFSDFINRIAPFDGNVLIQKTEHNQVEDDLFDSILFKKDTESSINSPSAAIDLDFVSVDLYNINSSGSIDTEFVLTISNLGTGQVARIDITKKSNDTYSFDSAELNQIENLDQTGTSLNFYIHNVGGTLIAESDLSISKSDSIVANNSNQLATSKAAFDLDAKKADKTQPDWVAIPAGTDGSFTITSNAFIKTNDQGVTSFKGTISVTQNSGGGPLVSIGVITAPERPDRDIECVLAGNENTSFPSALGAKITSSTGTIGVVSPGVPNTIVFDFNTLTYFQNG